MFDAFTRRPRDATASSRWLIATLSALAHLTVLAALVIAPLWYVTPLLPEASEVLAFVATPPAPPPPPPPAPTSERRRKPLTPTPASPQVLASVEAPSHLQPGKPAESTGTAGVLGGVEGGIPGGIVGGIVGGLLSGPPPPPSPRPSPPLPTPAPIRVGGQIKAPTLITRVNPEYPAIAQAAQLEGIVILEATVDQTGRVVSVNVLRSAGLLDGAAIDAVRQWRYEPLRLNGRPEPFVLTVTVQFHVRNRES